MLQVAREGPVKITRATVDAAWRRRASGKRTTLADAECRGLALVVNAGSMAWTFSYKPRGTDAATGKRFPSRSITIGNPETHSPEAARGAARVLKGQAAAGADPAATRKVAIARDAERRARTASRLMVEYAAALPKRPKMRGTGLPSARHVRDEIAQATAAIAVMKAGDKPVAEIGVSDLRALLRGSGAMPATARARFGALSRFFDWAQDEGFAAANPCVLVAKARRPRAPAARSHYLTPADLARLWHAAGGAPGMQPVQRDLIRLLIAVPCRRGTAASLDWSHLDLAAGTWTQPGKLTKNGEMHRLHLHALALDMLCERHREAGRPKAGLVFPGPRSGRPMDSFTDMGAAVSAEAGLAGWRWHDFRRSFATALGEAGVAEPVADAVLNHRQAATRGGVLGVYQRAVRWPEQARAMEAWGEALAAAIDGRKLEAVKVVQLRSA